MTSQSTISTSALALLVLLGLIWGGSFTATAVALTEVGFWTTVAARVAGACLVLWAWVLGTGLPLPARARDWAVLLTLGVIGNAIPFSLITWGQTTVPSGLASILNASTAVFGVLVAATFFRDERLSLRKLAGVGLGLAGVILAMGVESLAALDLASLAQLALVGASVCYAFTGALGRVALRAVRPEVAAAGMMTGAALVMVPAALWIEGLPASHHSATVWAALAYSAFLATAIAYLIYYRLLASAGAGNTSFVTLLVAPVAIVLGAILLGEQLPPRAFAGLALLAAGLVVLDGRLAARLWPRAPQKEMS